MKQTSTVKMIAGIAGAAAVAGVGTALAMQNKKALKKNATRAMKTMGSMVNDISGMLY